MYNKLLCNEELHITLGHGKTEYNISVPVSVLTSMLTRPRNFDHSFSHTNFEQIKVEELLF
jgi:hypothetical protein